MCLLSEKVSEFPFRVSIRKGDRSARANSTQITATSIKQTFNCDSTKGKAEHFKLEILRVSDDLGPPC